MKLNYASIVNGNTDEYPYRTATVIKLPGSTIQFPFYKAEPSKFGEIETGELASMVVKQMREDKDTSAVVFQGSEPLSQGNGLMDACKQLKENGVLVKVETSGAYADGLKALLPYIHYVSIEVPTSDLQQYKQLVGGVMPFDVFYANLQKSFIFMEKADCYFELKTTVIQGMNDNEEVIEQIGKMAPHADQHTLKQFVPEPPLIGKEYEQKQPVSRRKLIELGTVAKKKIGRVAIKCHECEALEL